MNNEMQQQLAPFFLSEYEGTRSLCLDAGDYLMDLFETRAEEGFEGSGYDWEALALVFLEEEFDGDAEAFDFDSEAGMFCVSSDDADTLLAFALAFKKACEDPERIADLFSRAELQ